MKPQLCVKASTSDAEKHESDINSIVFAKNCVFSGADDGKVKKWDENLKLLCEVQAHPCSVFCLAASEDRIFSCSNDGSIRSWSIDDLSDKGVIVENPEMEFWRICYNMDRLFAGTDVGHVIIYNKQGELVEQLEMLEPIKDMVVQGNMIYTVRDLELAVTELRPGEKGRSVNKKMIRGRAPVAVVEDKICLSSREGKDILVNENSVELHYKDIANVKDAHDLIINALCGAKRGDSIVLYSGGWDKNVKQWNVTKDACTLISNCQLDIIINVFCIHPNGQVYAAGGDGKIFKLEY